MAYNFQYQAKTEPVLLIIASMATWFMPLAEPVRDQAFEVASDISTFIVPVTAPAADVSVSSWNQPLSEPVRLKSGIAVQQSNQSPTVFVVTPPVSLDWYLPLVDPVKEQSYKVSSNVRTFSVPFYPFPDKWFIPLSEPVRPKLARQQQDLAYGYLAPSSQVIPIDWSQALYQPRLEGFDVVSDISTFVVPTTAAPTDTKWIYPWSEPVRQKPGLGVQHQQAAWLVKAAPFPETVTEDRWHQPWSTPTLRKPSTPQQDLAYVKAPTEIITQDKWYQAWSTPIFRKPSTTQQTLAYGPVPIVAEDKWHQPWSVPTRRKPSTTQQDLAYGYLAPTAPVTVTPIDWAQELYQPRPEGFDVVSDTSVFIVPTTAAVTDIKWQPVWPDRISGKTFQAHQQQSFTGPIAPPAVTPIDWAQQLFQPRLESFDVVSDTAVFIAISAAAPAAADIKWQTRWPDRLYAKTLPTAAYQVSTYIPVKTLFPFSVTAQGPVFTQVTQYQSRSSFVPIVAPPPPVVPIDWSQELYQPLPQSYDVVSDTSVFVAIANPPTPDPGDIKWQSRWPDRLYSKSLPVSAYQVSTHIPVKTFYPFSVTAQGPVFTQITPYQSVAFPPPIVTPPPVVTEDEWHQPWSLPVRTKPGLRTGDQPFLAYGHFTPPISIGWLPPLSEPAKPKRSIFTGSQQALAYGYFVPPISMGWLPPLSEPPKPKTSIRTSAQQFLAAVPFIEDKNIYAKWGFPWSEPVRDQAYEVSSSIVVYPFEFVPAHVNVTLAATETNGDVFSGLIKTYGVPVRCLVSIKEIPVPAQNLSSIHET
jgi:hypothetical protein